MDDLKHFEAMSDVDLERIVKDPANPTIDRRAREILARREAATQLDQDRLAAERHAELVALASQPAALSREQRFTLWTATIAAVVAAVLALPPFLDWVKQRSAASFTPHEARAASSSR